MFSIRIFYIILFNSLAIIGIHVYKYRNEDRLNCNIDLKYWKIYLEKHNFFFYN